MRGREHIARMPERCSGGFTLTEMLVAMIVVALLGTAITVGLSAGFNEYRAAIFADEAHILSMQLDDAMGDVFRSLATARDAGSASGYSYQAKFLGHTLTAPTVEAASEGDGTVLDIVGTESGSTVRYHLLNGGAYTDCQVANVTFDINPETASADEYGSAGKLASKVTVSFDIVRKGASAPSRHYEYTYVPVLATKSTA